MTRLGLIFVALTLSTAVLAEETPLHPPGLTIVTTFGPEGVPFDLSKPTRQETTPPQAPGQRESLGPTITK